MKLDREGNVYLAEKGILVFDAHGEHLQTIDVPEQPTNLCFAGRDGRTLFITARTTVYTIALRVAGATATVASKPATPYCIVDTQQVHCFGDRGQLLQAPTKNTPFFGQDAHYQGVAPSYRDGGDGTIADLRTGLMWQKTPETDHKVTFAEAFDRAKASRLAGHADWRVPSIKELYSLIDFNGNSRAQPPVPYLDPRFFEFRFGDEQSGERLIDAQYWSSTEYVGLTMRGNATVFGVNFADGRIKGYPRDFGPRGQAKHILRLVRGNTAYGKNHFVDNRDGSVSDLATGLMWQRDDSGKGLTWEQALAYAENLTLAGHDDWRLPNAKELQGPCRLHARAGCPNWRAAWPGDRSRVQSDRRERLVLDEHDSLGGPRRRWGRGGLYRVWHGDRVHAGPRRPAPLAERAWRRGATQRPQERRSAIAPVGQRLGAAGR